MNERGTASVEYLAIIGVVGILFAGLVALRPQPVGHRTPVDVIPPIVRLLGHPVENLAPRAPRRPAPPTSSVPRPHQPRPPRRVEGPVLVPLPQWWRP